MPVDEVTFVITLAKKSGLPLIMQLAPSTSSTIEGLEAKETA